MALHFESPAEACVAVALVVIGADQDFSKAEYETLFGDLARWDIFDQYTPRQLRMFISDTGEKLRQHFNKPGGQPISLSKEETARLIEAANEVLSPALRQNAFKMALDLASADTLRERDLLEQLREGFGLR